MKNEGDCCGTCESWVVGSDWIYVDLLGACHFDPPRVQFYGRTAWPETECGHWCRKHESKPNKRGVT